MQPLIPKWREKGIEFMLVAQEEGSTARFLEKHGLNTRVLLDHTGEVAAAYDVAAIPHTFWIDKDGVLRHASVGWREEDLNKFANLADKLSR